MRNAFLITPLKKKMTFTKCTTVRLHNVILHKWHLSEISPMSDLTLSGFNTRHISWSSARTHTESFKASVPKRGRPKYTAVQDDFLRTKWGDKALSHLWDDLPIRPLQSRRPNTVLHSLLIDSSFEHTWFGQATQGRGHSDTLVVVVCSLHCSNNTWHKLFKSCGIFTTDPGPCSGDRCQSISLHA